MHPKMSCYELLDVLVFVVKGSRVIDRTETDWGKALLLDRQYVESRYVYTEHEVRKCLGQRKADAWLNDADRWIEKTLEAAMQFADDAANGKNEEAAKRHENMLIEIEIEALAQESVNLQAQIMYKYDALDSSGQYYLHVQDPKPPMSLPLIERLRVATEKRDALLAKIQKCESRRAPR